MRYLFILTIVVASATVSLAAEPLFETTVVFGVTRDNRPNYRIPALVKAANGDLLVIAEKRNDGPGDIGNHDIVLKRSADQGRTWGNEQIVFDDEARVCTDLTVGIDARGKLWLFFLRDKKQYWHFTSTDDGRTWQGPTSIHRQVTRPEWDELASGKSKPNSESSGSGPPRGRMAIWEQGWEQRYGCGPGNAVVELRRGPHAGRMLVPARHREDVGGGKLRTIAHCFYSDDRGVTWQLGGNIGLHASECQLVELADGAVRVIARDENTDDSPDNIRHLTSVSRDGGATWEPLSRLEELISPRCHGCVERLSLGDPSTGKNRLLFSAPASPYRQAEHPYGRYNLTVRLSYDDGASWTAGRTVWPHPSAYSDLAVLDDGTIGLIYERGPKGSTHYWDELHFARFNLQWVTQGKDALP